MCHAPWRAIASLSNVATLACVHSQNNLARFDTDCRKVSNGGQGGARIEHVRPLRPRTDTGVTCRFEL